MKKNIFLVLSILLILFSGCVEEPERNNPYDPAAGIKASTLYGRVGYLRDEQLNLIWGYPGQNIELYRVGNDYHSYFVTIKPAPDGNFQIPQIPAGKYIIKLLFSDCYPYASEVIYLHPFERLYREIFLYIISDYFKSIEKWHTITTENAYAYVDYDDVLFNSNTLILKVQQYADAYNDPREEVYVIYHKDFNCGANMKYVLNFDFHYFFNGEYDSNVYFGIQILRKNERSYKFYLNTYNDDLYYYDDNSGEVSTSLTVNKWSRNTFKLIYNEQSQNGKLVLYQNGNYSGEYVFSPNYGEFYNIKFFLYNEPGYTTNNESHFVIDNVELSLCQ